MVSVDGTDFRIAEQGSKFYSHKFKKSGLRYEVGLCILSGEIVWINGPYECGIWNDILIFCDSILTKLTENERIEADDGYVGEAPRYIKCPKSFGNPEETLAMQARLRSRQETVNNRFKNWGVMRQTYRHSIPTHGDAFRAVAVITQISILNGESLFECSYRDPPFMNEHYDDGAETKTNECGDTDADSDISFDSASI